LPTSMDDIQITAIELQTDFHKICWETRRWLDMIFTRSAAGFSQGVKECTSRMLCAGEQVVRARGVGHPSRVGSTLFGRACDSALLPFSSRRHVAAALGRAVGTSALPPKIPGLNETLYFSGSFTGNGRGPFLGQNSVIYRLRAIYRQGRTQARGCRATTPSVSLSQMSYSVSL
jgi:hypothetical protein